MPLHLPPDVAQALAIDDLEPKCPACKMGRYADSDKRYVECVIERVHFAVESAPTAVLSYCANEDGYSQCPSWVAMKDGDDIVARTYAAQDAAHMREAERGLRATTPMEDYLAEAKEAERQAADKRIDDHLNS